MFILAFPSYSPPAFSEALNGLKDVLVWLDFTAVRYVSSFFTSPQHLIISLPLFLFAFCSILYFLIRWIINNV